MNRGEMVAIVRGAIRRGVEKVSDETIVQALNAGQMRVARLYNHEKMKQIWEASTMIGQDGRFYSLPAGTKDIVRLEVDERRADSLGVEEFGDERIALGTSSSVPRLYCWHGDYFEVAPVPDAAYVMMLWGFFYPSSLASDTAETLLTDFEWAICSDAASKIAGTSLGELEEAAAHDRAFKQQIVEAIEERGKQGKSRRGVMGGFDSGVRGTYDPTSPWARRL